jgi:hypothetical protein
MASGGRLRWLLVVPAVIAAEALPILEDWRN